MLLASPTNNQEPEMIPRLYLPPDSGATTDPTLTGASLPLSKEQSHYLARVLRLEEGAALVVFDGCGGEWEATFLPPATAHIGTPTGRNPESPLDLTLACAIGKGDRFDWVLQKATEAGVTRIVPLLTRRTQVKIEAGQKEERKLERWQAIVMEAAEQSERTVIPEIAPPITPSRLDLSIPTLVAFERGGRPMEQLLADIPTGPLQIAIGPEGGWDPEEVADLSGRGAHLLSLGPRILRMETAALAVVALAQALRGDWR